MNEKELKYYFDIFKAFQAPILDEDMAERRQYGIRAFSSTQGWFFDNTWRVVGITQDALEAFKAVDFDSVFQLVKIQWLWKELISNKELYG